MASTINGTSTGSGGLITTGDDSGILNIQTNETTAITVDASQNVTLVGTLTTSSRGIAKASMPTGSVLQVVNATYAVQVGNATNAMVDTGLTATITPTSASSKILVLVNQTGCQKPALDTSINLKLFRGATEILLFGRFVSGNGVNQANLTSVSTSYLDSPATTSATTYKTQFNNDSPFGTCYVQFGSATFPASTITLMEIAA